MSLFKKRQKRNSKSEIEVESITDGSASAIPKAAASSAGSSPANERTRQPKKKQFAGQHPDETVQLVFHQHPIVMRMALIWGLLVLTVSSLPLGFVYSGWPWYLLGAGIVIMICIFIYRWISWYFSIFIITDERLIQIKQKGFFDRRVTDISHNKIQSVNYEVRGFNATLFHYGTLIVQTYVGDLVLRYIHKPENVQQRLVKNIRAVKSVDISEVEGGPDTSGEVL